MDTEAFLLSQQEICRRMDTRRAGMSDAKASPWSWISNALQLASKVGGFSATESNIPRMLFPLAAPLLGAAFGFLRNRTNPSGKKPFWTRFVPFL
jgi:hypothetical protein